VFPFWAAAGAGRAGGCVAPVGPRRGQASKGDPRTWVRGHPRLGTPKMGGAAAPFSSIPQQNFPRAPEGIPGGRRPGRSLAQTKGAPVSRNGLQDAGPRGPAPEAPLNPALPSAPASFQLLDRRRPLRRFGQFPRPLSGAGQKTVTSRPARAAPLIAASNLPRNHGAPVGWATVRPS